MSLVVGTVLACGSIRQDEFLCENAASHLQACCPNFNVSLSCSFVEGCEENTYPELDTVQSNCILEEPCDGLRNSGVCELVAQLPDQGLAAGVSTPPVCTQPTAIVVDAGISPPFDAGPIVPEIDTGTVTPAVACASTDDCKGSGEVCCAQLVPPNVVGTCAPSCQTGLQSCASTSECGPGTACELFPGLSVPKLCVPVDVSPVTTTDAADAQSEGGAEPSDAGVPNDDGGDGQVDGSGP